MHFIVFCFYSPEEQILLWRTKSAHLFFSFQIPENHFHIWLKSGVQKMARGRNHKMRTMHNCRTVFVLGNQSHTSVSRYSRKYASGGFTTIIQQDSLITKNTRSVSLLVVHVWTCSINQNLHGRSFESEKSKWPLFVCQHQDNK